MRRCGCYITATVLSSASGHANVAATWWPTVQNIGGDRAGDGHPSRILVWLVPPGRFVPICFQSLQLDASYPLCPCRPQKKRPLRELLEITMSRTSANSSVPRKSIHKTISLTSARKLVSRKCDHEPMPPKPAPKRMPRESAHISLPRQFSQRPMSRQSPTTQCPANPLSDLSP